MSFPATREEMLAQSYQHVGSAVCKGCGVPIEFWMTPKGNRIPMNLMLQENSIAMPHFASCPHAETFRRNS